MFHKAMNLDIEAETIYEDGITIRTVEVPFNLTISIA